MSEGSDTLKPEHLANVKGKVKKSKTDSTVKAYTSDWADFQIWCEDKGYSYLPASPQIVAGYISVLADAPDDRKRKALSTIDRRLAAIRFFHRNHGYSNPCDDPGVRLTRDGIHVERAEEHAKTKTPMIDQKQEIRTFHIHEIIDGLNMTELRDVRDKAILLLGFNSGMRRSELAGIDLADITHASNGFSILKRTSKTDKQGRGHIVEIGRTSNADTCAVTATYQWLDDAGISKGALFRRIYPDGQVGDTALSGQTIAAVVKKHVATISGTAGISPKNFAGHSMRRGFVTQAIRQQISTSKITQQTGHTSDHGLAPYLSLIHI